MGRNGDGRGVLEFEVRVGRDRARERERERARERMGADGRIECMRGDWGNRGGWIVVHVDGWMDVRRVDVHVDIHTHTQLEVYVDGWMGASSMTRAVRHSS